MGSVQDFKITRFQLRCQWGVYKISSLSVTAVAKRGISLPVRLKSLEGEPGNNTSSSHPSL